MPVKFAIIKERKTPPDRRVVFSPKKCQKILEIFPEASIKVESSDIRIFDDTAYLDEGIEVSTDISDCDVLLGVKEVPITALISNKKYFFFSHTIKQQPYNRKLLQAILKNKIELYDHETIVKENGERLIGFGRYAGLVGAYNTFRALGIRDGLFNLPKVESLVDFAEMKLELDKIKLPAIKIVLTGRGKVAKGAKEIIDHLKLEEVAIEEYLTKTYKKAVYCYIDVMDYNKKMDGEAFNKTEFFEDPIGFESNFMRFSQASDVLIAGHFYGENAPFLFTKEDAKHPAFKINMVGDISCDIDGPIASTLRASTIADPFYGYNSKTEKEVAFDESNAITVMAVDNLPCELPKDASDGFGRMFFNQVIPAFFNNDKDGILERAKITTSKGTLTERFSYLQDYIEGRD
ncbi:MAG: NAD(P)-dependent oxidoreductase [Flavobacteriaceae bacterium]|nr:NAD(P)-dependent oxidoreductase [Flavobacteriaceae bacterium]